MQLRVACNPCAYSPRDATSIPELAALPSLRTLEADIVRASTRIAGEKIKSMKSADGSTVIGRSVTIHGELSGQEDLFLDGTVEGTVSLPENRLTIGPNARIKAEVDAGDVIIFGQVAGNIRAAGRIELRDSAIVHGDIIAERLSIEENATIKGRVELSDVSARTATVSRLATDPGGPASS
jgi:cytoskeletal protein CcmA (bactofilin family)